MKSIILVGEQRDNDPILNQIKNSSEFKIKQINPEHILKTINENNPDFVLCTGKIRINSEGKYFLEI